MQVRKVALLAEVADKFPPFRHFRHTIFLGKFRNERSDRKEIVALAVLVILVAGRYNEAL